MKKQIFIINGSGGVGKDTFIDFFNEAVGGRAMSYSTITPAKKIAKYVGWDGLKTEKARKFLSDLKALLNEFNDYTFKCTEKAIDEFFDSECKDYLFIQCREPEEIKRYVETYKAKTILITNGSVDVITSNNSDRDVFNYSYDFTFSNNDSIEEFKSKVTQFAKEIVSNTIKRTVSIQCTDEEEMCKVETLIHNQLVGNEDYINSRICLNDSRSRNDGTENEIHIVFFNDCTTDPQLLIP